ncbi:hypothetical protein, partial [Ruminococcus bromii]|uniref:hypothetical protein n=1 Tax=Ruminococcus bromii TaxID=40518 RepID=UPI002E769437
LSMTRHPASVFTARFQDCEFVYHVLAQVVTMLHLTYHPPDRKWQISFVENKFNKSHKMWFYYSGKQ